MAYMMGRATVEDYDTFRKAFDGAEELRNSAGAISSSVYQSVDDPSELIVEIEFPTADAAKAFMNSPGLREAQERAGAVGEVRMLVVNKV